MKDKLMKKLKSLLDVFVGAELIPSIFIGFRKGFIMEKEGSFDDNNDYFSKCFRLKMAISIIISIKMIVDILIGLYNSGYFINIPVSINREYLIASTILIVSPVLLKISNKIGETTGGIFYYVRKMINDRRDTDQKKIENNYTDYYKMDNYSFYDYHKSYIKQPSINERKIELLETKKELLKKKKKTKDFTLKLKK